jgi:hypothetical protein
MANRLMTLAEVRKQIVEPYVKAVEADLKENPLKPGEQRVYPNPGGRDMLPIVISGPPLPKGKERAQRGKTA